MKLILQREVEKLGVPGDVVDVADGFGRNYLLPRGLAVPATKGAVRHAERLKVAHQSRVAHARSEAEGLAERLSGAQVRIPARVGEEGRLFGSITAERLAEAIQEASGVEIDRRRVHLAEPIRSVGVHEVSLTLHPEVTATIPVEVVPE